jgi:hypothetical protein
MPNLPQPRTSYGGKLEAWALKVLGTLVAAGLLGAYGWLWNTNNTQTEHKQKIAQLEVKVLALEDQIEGFEADNNLVIRLEERLDAFKETLIEIKAAVNAL